MTLVFLIALSTLSLNMFLPSLANIAADFDADYAVVSLAMSGYLAVTGVVQLLVGPLSDRIGRRPVLLTGVLVFAISSIGCLMATNVWAFLFFRMLQAAIISGYTLSLAIVRDTTNEEKAASLIGYISMSMAFAPMLGPIAGGVLDASFGWRSTFWFYAISGFALFVLCWVDLGETRPEENNNMDSEGHSVTILLREREFWAFALCIGFSTSAFYVFLTGASFVAQSTFGISSAQTGIYVGSITAGFMTGSFISGRYASRFALTTLAFSGTCVACGGLLFGIVMVQIGFLHPLVYFGSTILVGLGNGLTMPGSNASAMSIRPELAGSAAGIIGALTVSIGSILTAITGILIEEEQAPTILLLMMFGTSFAGMVSILAAIRFKHQKTSPA